MPELDTKILPSSSVLVKGGEISVAVDVVDVVADDRCVVGDGNKVIVEPRVVSILISVTLGRETVSEPITVTDAVAGRRVNVAPIVVIVVGLITAGKVTVCVPITDTWPVPLGPEEYALSVGAGSRVNVSPRVVKRLVADTIGRFADPSPLKTIPALDVITAPSGAVQVVAEIESFEN